jgi:hypothetical protein
MLITEISRIEDGLCFSFLSRRQRTEPCLGREKPVPVGSYDLIAPADSTDAIAPASIGFFEKGAHVIDEAARYSEMDD